MTPFVVVDKTCDNAKVRAWGERFCRDPNEARALLQVLTDHVPTTGTAAELYRDFSRLTPWEQAGVVDELRDAIDKLLGEVYEKHVAQAKALEEG